MIQQRTVRCHGPELGLVRFGLQAASNRLEFAQVDGENLGHGRVLLCEKVGVVQLPTNLLTTHQAVNRHTAYMDSIEGTAAN